MTGTEHLDLASEFPEASREQWLALVERVILKGVDGADADAFDRAFAKQLVTTTYDGIEIQPLYTRDVEQPDEAGYPGAAPFVRGSNPAGTRGGWDIRQRVDVVDDGTLAGPRVLAELSGGATSILLGLRDAPAIDVDVLDRALSDVLLDLAPVALDAGPRWHDAATALIELWERRGLGAATVSGVLGADPIGDHLRSGGSTSLDRELDTLASVVGDTRVNAAAVRTVVVDGTPFHDAGGADAEELGASLAIGVAYLRALTDRGVDVDAACEQLEFRYAASADQFLTIAKLRAARRLWTRVAEVVGATGSAQAQRQHAVSSTAMMTRYDPWVNLLRTTVAAFAAGVGGADAVTIQAYDRLRDADGSELGRRLARNTQAMLIEESNLAQVIDPAGGSWYIESLTEELAQSAWAWFQEIERAGGVVDAFGAGLVQERIGDTWARRQKNIARRKDPITGVTEFPNIDEEPPPSELTGATTDRSSTPFAPLGSVLYAEEFEQTRSRSDRHLAATGARPAVFLANLGPLAAHTARTSFAKNLFEVGGIRVVPGSGDATTMADELAASGTTVACICSSDAIYAEEAADAARTLIAAGATRVLLAGRPGDLQAALDDVGVAGSISAGCDVLDVLSATLDHLGVGS